MKAIGVTNARFIFAIGPALQGRELARGCAGSAPSQLEQRSRGGAQSRFEQSVGDGGLAQVR